MSSAMLGVFSLAVKDDVEDLVEQEKTLNLGAYLYGLSLIKDVNSAVLKEKNLNLALYATAVEVVEEIRSAVSKYLVNMGVEKSPVWDV